LVTHLLSFLALILKEKAHYPFKRAGTTVYEKLSQVHQFIKRLFKERSKLAKKCDKKTMGKLTKLNTFLRDLFQRYKADYTQIAHFNSLIDKIRALFQEKTLSEKESSIKLKALATQASYGAKNTTIAASYRRGYAQLLKTIRSWQTKLFVFKSHPLMPETNNALEHLFKATKSWMRRTSGVKFGNRTFSLFGNYIIFVDTTLSCEKILQFLQYADYKGAYSKMKLEQQLSFKRNRIRIKVKQWDSLFQKDSQTLISSYQLS
jgi:hypothetical protein